MASTHQVPRGSVGSRRSRERGQNLVEFAFILPLFLVLVFAIVDFGMGFRAWISITNSAREGARVGAVRGSCDAIRDRVKDTSGGLVTADSQITITPSTCDGAAGSEVVVTVEYDYDFVSPNGGLLSMFGGGGVPSSVSIQSTSNMRVE